MKKRKSKQLKRTVNNLTSRIKGNYPHLYGSLGGRYIRRVLRDMHGVQREPFVHPLLSIGIETKAVVEPAAEAVIY